MTLEIFIDIEANGLLYEADRLWVVTAKNLSWPDPSKAMVWHHGMDEAQLEGLLRMIQSADKIIGHNILGYDLPLIRKLYPWFKIDLNKVEDTFVASSLFKPDRAGGHSLDSWGRQLGMYKLNWTHGFDEYHPEMPEYCERDVDVTIRLYQHLFEGRVRVQPWRKALRLEYGMAEYHSRQVLHGVAFNMDKAFDLADRIYSEIQAIDEEILPQLPHRVIPGTEMKKPFVMSGGYSAHCKSYMGDKVDQVWGPFQRVEFQPFNINSHDQVKQYLLDNGWRPTQYNTKQEEYDTPRGKRTRTIETSPKLTEDSFDSVEGNIPAKITHRAKLLSRGKLLFNVRKRDNMLTGLINLVRSDGRIAADGVPQGTPTGRYRHSGVVNIPKNDEKVLLGKEVRELFEAGDGFVLVGCDAQALEARMEAHECYDYRGGVTYAHELIDGDIHEKNALLFGTDRDGAKSPKYAMTYGAQPPKLARTIPCSLDRAREIFDAFWEGNTALAGFRDAMYAEWQQHGGERGGYVRGLDGRKLYVRSPHSIVNMRFQSAGSIVVKTATLYLDKWVKSAKLRAFPVIHYHDEFQWEVHPEDVEEFQALAVKAFEQAGKYYKLNVPIVGTVKIGNNWAETH